MTLDAWHRLRLGTTGHARVGPADEGDLSGVWRREGRSIGGSRLTEPSLVVWVQVAEWFADVRLPRVVRHPALARDLGELDRAQAFSGRLACEGDRARFVHDLDTLARSSPDEATIAWHGELLHESGDGYVERWRRVVAASSALPDGSVAVVERRSAVGRGGAPQVVSRVVQVGDVAAAVWSSPTPGGMLLQRASTRPRRPVSGRWRNVATAGDPRGSSGIDEVLAGLG